MPLLAVGSNQDVQQAKALLKKAVEYVTAMRIELARQDLRKKDSDPVR